MSGDGYGAAVPDRDAEVRDLYARYIARFGELARGDRDDVDALLEFYAVPWTTTSSVSHVVHSSAADVDAAFRPMIEGLRKAGYDRTVPDVVDIRVVNDRCATLESYGDRVDRREAVMHRYSGFFLMARGDSGWRIVAVSIPEL